MYTRRKFLVATAGASTVALAGCSGGSDDDNESENVSFELGDIDFDAAALRDNGTTVTLPVTNPAATSEVEATLTLLDGNGSEINSYTTTNNVEQNSTVDFEFDVDAAPNLAEFQTNVTAVSNSSE